MPGQLQRQKQKLKHQEGKPEVKGRVRRLQRQLAMGQIRKVVPKANVVITNPTHYAVALQYDQSRALAPVFHLQDVGQVVIGGNFVVGFVVFIILMIINFIVVTKGAERISEVSARFTLDAMPGKQMAIDADLNAGLINQAQAQTRRKGLF